MIKRIGLLLVAFIVAIVPVSNVNAYTGGGAGTSGNPYVITTCQQIFEINDDLDGYYVLANDVDCTGATWEHIGVLTTSAFSGTLDGQGYMIQNLSVNDTNGVGLFTYIDGATITNLHISDFNITGTGTVGILAAQADNATISGVRIEDSEVYSEYATGGLVGILNDSTISDSSTTNVLVSARAGAGSSDQIGGIVGRSINNTYNRNSTSGTVNGVVSVGGIPSDTGGFIGFSNLDVLTDNYSTADVTGRFTTGGFVGNSVSSSFTRAYASGTVDGLDTVGGFTGGSALSMLTDSFATGTVTGTTNVGGLIGRVQAIGGDVTNSTWDVTQTGQTNCVGLDEGISYPTTCLTGVNIASAAPEYFNNNSTSVPLNNWNFSTIWQTTSTLPTLRVAPARPDNVTVVPTAQSLRVRWQVPADTGGSAITSYDLKYRATGSQTYNTVTSISAGSSPEYTITGLTPSTSYDVEVRAQSASGPGTWLGFITFTSALVVVSAPFVPSKPASPVSYFNDSDTEETPVTTTQDDTPIVTDNTPVTTTDKTSEGTTDNVKTNTATNPVLITVIVIIALGGIFLLIRIFVRK